MATQHSRSAAAGTRHELSNHGQNRGAQASAVNSMSQRQYVRQAPPSLLDVDMLDDSETDDVLPSRQAPRHHKTLQAPLVPAPSTHQAVRKRPVLTASRPVTRNPEISLMDLDVPMSGDLPMSNRFTDRADTEMTLIGVGGPHGSGVGRAVDLQLSNGLPPNMHPDRWNMILHSQPRQSFDTLFQYHKDHQTSLVGSISKLQISNGTLQNQLKPTDTSDAVAKPGKHVNNVVKTDQVVLSIKDLNASRPASIFPVPRPVAYPSGRFAIRNSNDYHSTRARYSKRSPSRRRHYYEDKDNPRAFPYEHGFQPSSYRPSYQADEAAFAESRWALDGDLAMADVDRYHGRGQRFNPGAGRKRRFAEYDDYDRRPPRRRHDDIPPSARVRKALLGLGEQSHKNPEDEVRRIASDIAEYYHDEVFCEKTSDLIAQMLTEQPFKIAQLAAITLYVNQQRPEVVRKILAKVQTKAQSSVDSGEWRALKLLLRYIGLIHGIFEGGDIFDVLQELFNRVVDLQTASPDDTFGLELAKIIMITIPWAMASTASGLEAKANEILDKTGIIATAPREDNLPLEPFFNHHGEDAAEANVPASFNYVALLQTQLQNEKEQGWPLAIIPRLFRTRKPATENETDGNIEQEKHVFPSIVIPATLKPTSHVLSSEVFFSLYADQDNETAPPTSNVASSILRDAFVDTINILDFNRNTAARFLIDADMYWAPDCFMARGTPLDKIKELKEEGKPTWKVDDLVIDAIFSQILQLPIPEHKLVYYHAMIMETCKIAPAHIAPSLGRAIRFMYRNLESMDLELAYRFMDWFSHHLSNFEFRWKWNEWLDDMGKNPLEPHKWFILGVLDKEVRLSFAKRIRDNENFPESYRHLVPTSRDNDIPEYKYSKEQTDYSTQAKELLALIKSKVEPGELEPPMSAIETAEAERVAGMDSDPVYRDAAPILASTDALITTLAYIGSKSLSHILSYIDRYHSRLLSLGAANAAARVQIIDSIVSYWREVQPGVGTAIVDKLLNYTIVTPTSVVEWALLDQKQLDAGRILATHWVYEMVSSTLLKVSNRVRQIVAARQDPTLVEEQTSVLDETLAKERTEMRDLFVSVTDALKSVADGSNDVMMEEGLGEEYGGEAADPSNGDAVADAAGDAATRRTGGEIKKADELRLLKWWGAAWLRVFRRRLGVEMRWITEAARQFPPPALPAPEPAPLAVPADGDVVLTDAPVVNGAALDGAAGDALQPDGAVEEL